MKMLKSWRVRIAMFLAVVGPGFITANAWIPSLQLSITVLTNSDFPRMVCSEYSLMAQN